MTYSSQKKKMEIVWLYLKIYIHFYDFLLLPPTQELVHSSKYFNLLNHIFNVLYLL